MFRLGLLYQPAGGPLLEVASTGNQVLLQEVASMILREADDRAERLGRNDPFLAEAQRAEASRLRRLLGQAVTPATAAVM